MIQVAISAYGRCESLMRSVRGIEGRRPFVARFGSIAARGAAKIIGFCTGVDASPAVEAVDGAAHIQESVRAGILEA